MTFKLNGVASMKNIKIDQKKIKILIALILSNVFFFILFSGTGQTEVKETHQKGWVEVKIAGISHTPFAAGKKILLIHKGARIQLEGQFIAENETHFYVSVKELEAHHLFKHEAWEIIPYLSNLTFSPLYRGSSHEILY
jgi:hypothetical protein